MSTTKKQGPEQMWSEGDYVLGVDSYVPQGFSLGDGFALGDTVPLSESDAVRLGSAGAVFEAGSESAEICRKVAAGELPRTALADLHRDEDEVSEEIASLEKQQQEAEARLKLLKSRISENTEQADGEG